MAAAVGVAEEQNQEVGIDAQDFFDGVVLFLAALTCGLLRRVLGADDPSLRAVMGTRGATGAAGPATPGAGFSASARTTVAASASETPQR
jgi:hypothetical protein